MKFVALLSLVLAPLALASCRTTEVLFARGSFEPQGDGWIVGPFLHKDAAATLAESSFYNVVYPASPDFNTSTPVGTADMMRRITEQAKACPETEFALTGYSQGVMVIHGVELSADLKQWVKAVVSFGDPCKWRAGYTWPIHSVNVWDKCVEDPVCTGGTVSILNHLSYMANTNEAVDFIRARV